MEQLTTGAEQSAPKFVLRRLNAGDVWQFARVISKVGIRDFAQALGPEVSAVMKWNPPMMMGSDGEQVPLPRDQWTEAQVDAELRWEMARDELIWSVLGRIMDKIGDCESDVNKLLSMGTGMTVEQISQMDANDYIDLIVAYISRDGFTDFFMHAFRLVGKASHSKKSYGVIMEMSHT